jgi:dihydropyrimidinase
LTENSQSESSNTNKITVLNFGSFLKFLNGKAQKMHELVVKNGKIFLNNGLYTLDLAIDSGKISAIGSDFTGRKEIDARDMWVLPAAIDAHTHFSLPFAKAVSADDFFTGTKAASIGGVTTIIDFLAQNGDEGIFDSLSKRKTFAEGKSTIDYSFHACIKNYSKAVASDLPEIAQRGLTSLKVFMAYGKTGMMQTDAELLRIMKDCRKNGILLTVHSENGTLIDTLTDNFANKGKKSIKFLPETRPVISETEAISRLAMFARETGCLTYVVHTSSGAGAEIIVRARKEKSPIVAETCPQYLYLDESNLKGDQGHLYSCCPPIRSLEQQKKLWQVFADGGISVVATDHCPFTRDEKKQGREDMSLMPMGLPGVETSPAMILSAAVEGKIPLGVAIASISENPAKIFGLYPEKGSLLPGTDADIMIFNPNRTWIINNNELNMNLDYSPYQGYKIKGRNQMTIFRGNIIFDQKTGWSGKKGAGRFIERKKTDSAFFK